MGSWLTGGAGRVNAANKPAAALRVQTALQGEPIAILLGGRQRLACNLIDYSDFSATQQSNGSGKGLGAVFGKGNSGSYVYSAAVIAAICEGPVASIDAVWNNKTRQALADLNLTAFLGTYSQSPWGYMSSTHGERALAYRGLAYAAAGPMQLGDVPELPNLNFEVTSTRANAIAGAPDADPKDCVTALLTDENFGVGFPSGLLADLSDYSTYCKAAGLVVSPAIASITAANAFLADLLAATNSNACWSAGVLKIVPYGDQAIEGNGTAYTPDTTPIYDLTADDFVAAADEDPVKITRAAQSDRCNKVSVEYLDRAAAPDPETGDSRSYDPAIAEAKDDASIQIYGLRPADKRSFPFLCLGSAAQMCASLLLGREQIPNIYQFTLPRRFILLDVMDVVTLSDPATGLDRQPVRITEIKEERSKDGGRTYAITAEDWLAGSAAAPLYGAQANGGAVPDYNVAPGSVNTPIIFEPSNELAGDLEIWLAISGASVGLWGGADVYASYDGTTYAKVGSVFGAARTGKLTAALDAVAADPSGAQTVDETHTLSLSLAESGGTLTSGSEADARGLNTLMWVGGEFLAYRTATLTGANAYDLTFLPRGAYGTEASIVTHPIGAPIVRIDDALLKLPFTQDRIGKTVYFKFCSFNIWGGGKQSLADVGAIAYTIAGTALAAPLPDITNLRATFQDATSALTWDEVSDTRAVRYEIRKGDTWETAPTIGNVAHPPFTTYGDGTYWVAAIAQPLPGLTVYSANPVALAIEGSILVANVVATYDEPGTGWAGSVTGAGIIDSGIFKTNVFNQIAYYEIPPAHWFNVNYPRPVRLGATWLATAEPLDQNILSIADFLGQQDLFGAALSRFVESWVEVAVAQTGTGPDVFAADDVFDADDVFAGDVAWGEWVKFAPGVYYGLWFKFRLALKSVEANTRAAATVFKVSADVDDRVDHITDHALADTGETFDFTPDGGSTAVAFKGGPNGASVPLVNVQVLNASAGDDVLITSVSLSQMTVQVKNGGVGVARHVNITVQGW